MFGRAGPLSRLSFLCEPGGFPGSRSSKQAVFSEAERRLVRENHVVEDIDAEKLSGFAELPRRGLVLLGGLKAPARVVVGEDYRD